MNGLKKASNILFLVALIASFVIAGLYLLFGLVFVLYGSGIFHDAIITGLKEGIITTDFVGTVEEQANQIELLFKVMSIIYFVIGVFAFINGFLSLTARKVNSKGLYIANIVFGLLSTIEINIVAGIFGLITYNEKKDEIIE